MPGFGYTVSPAFKNTNDIALFIRRGLLLSDSSSPQDLKADQNTKFYNAANSFSNFFAQPSAPHSLNMSMALSKRPVTMIVMWLFFATMSYILNL